MFYEPNIYGGNPYSVRVWQCDNYGAHWHSNIEIYVCLQGQLDIEVEGTDYPLTIDDVLIVASNESHEIICDHPNTAAAVIAFGYNLLGSSHSEMQNVSFEHTFFNLGDETISEKILRPLSQIKDILLDAKEESVAQDWEIRSCLYAIAAYLSTHKHTRKVSKERQARAKQLENMYGVMNYIAKHYREQITVDDAAAIAGYGKFYFCRQFRETTGMTFHRYLNYYRVSMACQYLEDASVSTAIIAERAGFASAKMMSRLFREILGITPTEYRKLPAEKKNSIQPL